MQPVYVTTQFDDEIAPFSSGLLHLRVEDVTEMDVSSITVATRTLVGVAHRHGEKTELRETLSVDSAEPKRHYSVFVHLDMDGSGRLSVGDYVTMQSYPVLTFGHPNTVTVRLHRVG